MPRSRRIPSAVAEATFGAHREEKGEEEAGRNDSGVGESLWSFCNARLRAYPDFGALVAEDLARVPDVHAVFCPGRGLPVDRNIVLGSDYTEKVRELAHGVLGYCASQDDWFRTPGLEAEALQKVQAWIDSPGSSNFIIDRYLQDVLSQMRTSAWTQMFTDEMWREGIMSLVNVDVAGRSSWIKPAGYQQGSSDLPLTFMIAIAKVFATAPQWQLLESGVRNAFADSPGLSETYLSLANRTKNLCMGRRAADIARSVLPKLIADVQGACAVERDFPGPWQHIPKGEDRDFERQVYEVHGVNVAVWLTQKGYAEYFFWGSGHPEQTGNQTHNVTTRKEIKTEGACFLAGTWVLCLSANGCAVFAKPVEKVAPGDVVVAEHGELAVVSDEPVHNAAAEQLLIGFDFEGGTYSECFATAGHPFWTHDAGWCAVDEALANEENGFMGASQLMVGQCLYQAKAVALAGPFQVEVDYEALRVVRIRREQRVCESYGLHFRGGPRSYHADGFLVAMNYPEITYSRLMLGLQSLPLAERRQAGGQLQGISGLVARATGCRSIGGALQAGRKLPGSHCHQPKALRIWGHGLQAEWHFNMPRPETGRAALRLHGGHVSLELQPREGLWHWTESHHFSRAHRAEEVRFTRDGEVFARFESLGLALHLGGLRPDEPSRVHLRQLAGGATTLAAAVRSEPTVYCLFVDGVQRGELLVDVATVEWAPADPLWAGFASLEVDQEHRALLLSLVFYIPQEGCSSLQAVFAGDLQSFAGALLGREGKGPLVLGVLKASRPAPTGAVLAPAPALGPQPLLAAAPPWAAELLQPELLQEGEGAMGAAALFMMPPPDAEKIYSSVMMDLMDAALALFPADQASSLGMEERVKGKSVPEYLRGLAEEPEVKRALQGIVTAQVGMGMWKGAEDEWKPVAPTEEKLKLRGSYYLQSNAETCLGADPSFRKAFDTASDYHYARLMPEFQAYLQGQGGKSPGEWARLLYAYATQKAVLEQLVMQDPDRGAITKVAHMLKSLGALSPLESDRQLERRFADAVSGTLLNLSRFFAGSLPQEDMERLLKEIVKGFYERAQDMSVPMDEELRRKEKALFARLLVKSGTQLGKFMTGLISLLAKTQGLPTMWGKLYRFFQSAEAECPEVKLTPEVKAWVARLQMAASLVVAAIGVTTTALTWDFLTEEQKAAAVTGCISSTWAAAAALAKKGAGLLDIDPLRCIKQWEDSWSEVLVSIELQARGEAGIFTECAEEVARVWSSLGRQKMAQWGRGFVNLVLPRMGSFFGLVAGVAGLVAMGFTLKKDFMDHDVTMITLDMISAVTMVVGVAVSAAELAGVETILLVGELTLSVPVVGEVAAAIGIVAAVAAAIVRACRPTPQQKWVTDVGAPFLKAVAEPPEEWVAAHPVQLSAAAESLAPAATCAAAGAAASGEQLDYQLVCTVPPMAMGGAAGQSGLVAGASASRRHRPVRQVLRLEPSPLRMPPLHERPPLVEIRRVRPQQRLCSGSRGSS